MFFLADTVPGRLWKVEREKIRFDYRVLGGLKIPLPKRFPLLFNPGIKSALRREDPDLIICGGYHHPSSLSALRYAKKYRKRFVLWCESHHESVGIRAFPIDCYRKYFIDSSDGFVVPGRKSFDFIQGFDVSEKKIWIAPNAIDTELFRSTYGNFRTTGGPEQFRKRFDLPDFNILFVGRLAPEKGLPAVFKALHQIQKRGFQVGFVIVGDGPCLSEYEQLVRQLGLSHVVFVGFKQQEELSYYYLGSDVLVLPSHSEPWGLVVNEALTCGLPVLCSKKVGCADDLIVEGKTGFLCTEVKDYEEKIVELMTKPDHLVRMREHCYTHIEQFTPQHCADGFLNLCQFESNQQVVPSYI